jgi:diacylglycerol kinase (ATP)
MPLQDHFGWLISVRLAFFMMMPQKSALLVLNPVSGVLNPATVRARFEAVFQEAGWSAEVYVTSPLDSLAEIVRQSISNGVCLVVAAGGDGTISEVASALVGTGIPLGILPTGTWNALARNLGIPLLLEDALKLLTGPNRRVWLDALAIRGRHYLLNVGIGLSASVIKATLRQQKKRFGFLAYVWNLLVQTSGLRLRQFRLNIDGHEYKIRASELMVVNSSILGLGELKTLMEINPGDSKVEILAIRAPTLFGLAKIALSYLIGRRKKGPGYSIYSAAYSISIRSRRPVIVQADGEIIGRTPIEIQVRPAAVEIIIP